MCYSSTVIVLCLVSIAQCKSTTCAEMQVRPVTMSAVCASRNACACRINQAPLCEAVAKPIISRHHQPVCRFNLNGFTVFRGYCHDRH
jgi:hypothetical protein